MVEAIVFQEFFYNFNICIFICQNKLLFNYSMQLVINYLKT